jgi:hypothetical protein
MARWKAAISRWKPPVLLENEIWGQGFPAPLFTDEFEVEQQRVLKEKHLKLRLRKGNTRIDAIQFNFSKAARPHHSTGLSPGNQRVHGRRNHATDGRTPGVKTTRTFCHRHGHLAFNMSNPARDFTYLIDRITT